MQYLKELSLLDIQKNYGSFVFYLQLAKKEENVIKTR